MRASSTAVKRSSEEECVYVLSGQGTAFIGCPANGAAHAMQATGAEPLVCLVMGQRLSQDVSDYPNLKKRLYRNNGEWTLVAHSDIQHIQR